MSGEPKTIGNYTIVRELGRGSFAAVYLALAPGASRPIALKLLKKSVKDAEVLARFDRESEVGGRLKHPGIVPVLDQGADVRGPYLVLEYQEGGSLADRLVHGKLSSEEAAEIVVAVARAVHAAHEGGVIHRDLKPANILFDGLGNPRVTDFGLAHDEAALETMTRTGDVLGTPFYMAPEQISGSGVLDAQTDVYSMGVILYECLTGRRPYTTQRLDELVRMVLAGSPAPLGPGIAPAVRKVCRQAMSPDRSERFADAEAMADALELAILPPPPPPNKLVRAIVLLVVGALAIGAATFLVPRGPGVEELQSIAEAPTASLEPSLDRLQVIAASDHPAAVIREQLEQAQGHAKSPELRVAIRRLLALTLWRRGDLHGAEEAAEPGSVLQRFLRARRQECEGDSKSALRTYNEMRHGDGPLARIAEVAHRRHKGLLKEAKQAAAWLEAGEDGLLASEVAIERATVALLTGDPEGAKRRLEARIKEQPRDVLILRKLAVCARNEGDLVGAIKLLEEAIAACDQAPTFLRLMRARELATLGDETGAREELERASEADPRHWDVLFLRGRLAAVQQRSHEATQLFRRAAERCPDPNLILTRALQLPERIGVEALEAAGLKSQVPVLRGQASQRRRAKAVGGNGIFLALNASLQGEPVERVAGYFELARKDAKDLKALAWEEALFYVGRDAFAEADAAIARARELGFDPDRLRLLEGRTAGRRSKQEELYKALEAVANDGRGVARSIAFSELAGYAKDFKAAGRHAERALEEAPDDPLAWEAWLTGAAKGKTIRSSQERAELQGRVNEALARFRLSWLMFVEIEHQMEFFRLIEVDESREGWRRASAHLEQSVDMLASLGGGTRALLNGADMILMRPSNQGRALARRWLGEAQRRAFPHQQHEILLTCGWVELTQPKETVDLDVVIGFWRKAREAEPKAQMLGNWYQIYRFRGGTVERLIEEFGEDFLPQEHEDLEEQVQKQLKQRK